MNCTSRAYGIYDNYSGDVVVNTAGGFAADGRDLFTVLLQESGHALGVGHNPDPASAMYEFYRGARTGLSADDIAAIRALYGARTPDQYEEAAGNDALSTATRYSGPLTADLTTTADVDVYRFTAGLLTRSVKIDLRAAGLSLLTSKVELLDAAGRVLTSADTTDPTDNDIALSLGSVRAGSTYYVRVSAARPDVFGVGAYGLTISQQSLLSDLTGLVTGLLNETGLNDTLFAATSLLSSSPTVGSRTEFSADGSFGSKSDVDYYRIAVPLGPSGGPVNLLTTVWGKNGAALAPWVEVRDVYGRKLDGEVITADGNTTTLQVRGLVAGGTYFIKLSSDTQARGAYALAADLRPDTVTIPTGMSGTLAQDTPVQSARLRLTQTGQVHFVLAVDGIAGAGRGAEVIVTATDGSIAARFFAPVGRGRSLDVFLPAGDYLVQIGTTDPSTPSTIRLGAVVVTDPTGATPTDPTGTPEPTSPPPNSPPTSPPPPSPPPVSAPPEKDAGPAIWY